MSTGLIAFVVALAVIAGIVVCVVAYTAHKDKN